MICKKCKKQVYETELVKCVSCRQGYHHNCLNITTAVYMSKMYEYKKKWQCNECTKATLSSSTLIQKGTPGDGPLASNSTASKAQLNTLACTTTMSPAPKESTSEQNSSVTETPTKSITVVTSMPEESVPDVTKMTPTGLVLDVTVTSTESTLDETTTPKTSKQDYVTMRKGRQCINSPGPKLSDLLNISTKSLPTPCKCDRSVEITELIEMNDRLSLELEIANKEIENQLLEKNDLKNTLDTYKRKVEMYKSVSFDEFRSKFNKLPALKYYTPQPKQYYNIQSGYPRRCPIELTQKQMVTKVVIDDKLDERDSTDDSPNSVRNVDMATVLPTTDVINKSSTNGRDAKEQNVIVDQLISNNVTKGRVLIYGDEKAQGICGKLQNKLGSDFLVKSNIKSGAFADNVLKSSLNDCRDFKKSDYVIIMLGTNDNNPLLLQSILYFHIHNLGHTNIILCNNNRNLNLNENKVNDLFKHIAQSFSYVHYIETRNYERGFVSTITRSELTQLFLREILRLQYKTDQENYKKQTKKSKLLKNMGGNMMMMERGTQTDNSCDRVTKHSLHNIPAPTEVNNETTFFREQ